MIFSFFQANKKKENMVIAQIMSSSHHLFKNFSIES